MSELSEEARRLVAEGLAGAPRLSAPTKAALRLATLRRVALRTSLTFGTVTLLLLGAFTAGLRWAAPPAPDPRPDASPAKAARPSTRSEPAAAAAAPPAPPSPAPASPMATTASSASAPAAPARAATLRGRRARAAAVGSTATAAPSPRRSEPESGVDAPRTPPPSSPLEPGADREAAEVEAEVEAVPATSTLLAEARLLQAVQRALARGELGEARALLAAHRRRYPRGALARERDAATLMVRCREGRSAELARRARALLAANPTTPLSDRIRESCLGEARIP